MSGVLREIDRSDVSVLTEGEHGAVLRDLERARRRSGPARRDAHEDAQLRGEEQRALARTRLSMRDSPTPRGGSPYRPWA